MCRHMIVVLLLVVSAVLYPGVGDPQIMTDHPQMQGELSCSTYERIEATAYGQFKERYGHAPATETEKLIAHWMWRTEHHQHADGNTVFYGAGNPIAGSGWAFNRDGLMGLFSHSTGLCFSIHAQFTPFIQRALGDYLATSCTLVPGHTAFEAFTDGAWRLADITCGHLVFLTDPEKPVGILAIGAYQKAEQDKGRAYDDWKKDFNGGFMKLRVGPFGDKLNTYDSVRGAEGDGLQKMFGYIGMPVVYNLRTGETFTRFSDPAGDDGVEAIWSVDYYEQAAGVSQPLRHGMARKETFMAYGPIGNDNPGRLDKNSGRPVRNPLIYSGKGVFVYTPPLSKEFLKDEALSAKGIGDKKGKLACGKGAELVLEHASPYQIAAHQADDARARWDVFKNPCDKTAIVSCTSKGEIAAAISIDNGQTWQEAGQGKGTVAIDYTELVKGRFAYRLKLTALETGEISSLSMRTVVQIGPAVFPYLKEGGTTITYEASNKGVIHGGPDWAMAEPFKDKQLSSGDWTAYRIDAAGPIRSLHGVGMPTGRIEMTVETSVDGRTWDTVMAPVTMGRSGHEKNSSIWGDGGLSFMWGCKDYPANKSRTGFIRFKNLKDKTAQVYATYELPSKPGSLIMSVSWSEGGAKKEAGHKFKGSNEAQTWKLPTGKNVITNWIRFEAGE